MGKNPQFSEFLKIFFWNVITIIETISCCILKVRRSRGGALEQNEQKPENGSRAPPNGPILMTYTLKDWKFFTDSESVYIMTLKVNRGQIWVKS